ncbi:MAG: hypothetical protein KatS3mg057_0129 [Herpetosiphonaceae bacterium]|nr:MAG: hypothetical protein KatS3mg057_0129 [Herpetosiphonaceae bacterium]
MAQVNPLAPLERTRLYPALKEASHGLPQPRVLLFVGVSGSGKTVAGKLYLRQVPWPVVIVEPQPDQDHGWPIIQHALAALGYPSAHPAASIADIAEPTVFVIDPLDILLDDQGVPVPAAISWLSALFANPHIQLVLASRIMPQIVDLALLAADGQVRLVDGQELAFRPDEAQALWRLRQGYTLTTERAAELIERSGGHAALVALACASGMLPGAGHASFQDLLAAQILAHLPQDLLSPLVDLAVLETLTPSAIEALTSVTDGETFLRRLRDYGLISGEECTLHPLVRQPLLARLRADPARLIQATRKAIALLRKIDDDEEAWRLARSAELWDEAREIILTAGPRLRHTSRSRTLITWIESLPPAERTSEIGILLARAMGDVGDYDGSVIVLSELRAAAADPDEQRSISVWLANMLQSRGELEAADAIIRPYLDDPALTGIWRAYALRIHSLALMHTGEEEKALEVGQQTIMAAQAAGDRRMLAFAYQDTGVVASRAGRLAEAEKLFRFAERCWRDLGNPPEMAITLNQLAMVQLARGNLARAREIAEEARLRALAGERLREASIAGATCGDAALAQGHAAEAMRYYQIAAEEAERSAAGTNHAYSLSFLAHAARLCGSRDQADHALSALTTLVTPSLETRAWRATGIAAAQLSLGLPVDDQEIRRILELLGPNEAEVRGTLLILGAQIAWKTGNRRLALSRWAELEEIILRGRGGDRSRLAPLAACEPDLLQAVLATGQAPFAALVRERFPITVEKPQGAGEIGSPLLRVRVLGAEEILWHGKPVTLPKHGLALLVVLLTSSAPLEDEEIIRLLWGEQGVSWETLKKLVQRIRNLMPDVIRRVESRYMLTIPRSDVDFDLDRVLTLDVTQAPVEQLRALAEAGRDVLGAEPENGTWRAVVHDLLRRRMSLIWLELGRRAVLEGAAPLAAEAFAQAQRTDPASDLVARTAMQSALELGDRALAMNIYLRYRDELDARYGLEPARDLQDLYRQALEP